MKTKYKGIKSVYEEIQRLSSCELYDRVQVFIDLNTKEVWAEYFPDQTSWTEYHDNHIISFFVYVPITLKELKENIEFAIERNEEYV